MQKKWVKRILFGIGSLFLVVLIANFALNFYLKNKLPELLKKNTDYIINYNHLDVDLGTGNIFAKDISIKSKQPNNASKLALDGTIDTLKLSRFGIFAAVVKKEINLNDITIAHPQLTVRLPLPKNKSEKKPFKSPIDFENLHITNGDILINNIRNKPVFSVKKLNFKIEDLEFIENNDKENLPFEFGSYTLNGENLFIRPDDIQAIKADKLQTKDGLLEITNFEVLPLISQKLYKKYYPKKVSFTAFKSSKMKLTEVVMKNKKLQVKDLNFAQPELTIYKNSIQPNAKKKETDFEAALNNVVLNDAKITLINPDGSKNLTLDNVQVELKELLFNKETSKEKIPVVYKDFKISGRNIAFTDQAHSYTIEQMNLTPKAGTVKNVSVVNKAKLANKNQMDFTLAHLNFKLNNWGFKENKLHLDIDQALVSGLNGTLTSAEKKVKTAKSTNWDYPIKMRALTLKNSNFTLNPNHNPLVVKNVNLTINGLEINQNKANNGTSITVKNYDFKASELKSKNKFYNISTQALSFSPSKMEANHFEMLPIYSRSQFIKTIPKEQDLYTIRAPHIAMTGNWDLFSENKVLNASSLIISDAKANIFRSKIPPDDLRTKPMYGSLLAGIKFPLFISNLQLKNAYLEYEEDTPKSDGPGMLTFSQMNLTAKNINSAKMKEKPTEVPIHINCKFFGVSPMNVYWTFNTINKNDEFTIKGNIQSLPAPRINQFIEPYLKIRATGQIKELAFDFKGNRSGIGGQQAMNYENLKISILNKEGEKNKLVSGVANLFVKSNTHNSLEKVEVEDVKRDQTASFFNLFWKGIEQGLKKTLIGKNVDKTEEKVKNTVKDINEAKKEVNNVVKDVKNTVQNITTSEKSNKTEKKNNNIIKRVFKKKEKTE